MQIVIDILEEDKQEIDRCLEGNGLALLDKVQLIKRVVLALFHGKPLPKGHGRLIDSDATSESMKTMIKMLGENKVRPEQSMDLALWNIAFALADIADSLRDREGEENGQ